RLSGKDRSRVGAPPGPGGGLARALSEATMGRDSLEDSADGIVLLLRDSGENKKASPARRPVATVRSNTMAQTQSETLTRRDALATGATMLGATTFGTMGLSTDEPKSRRKVRIGVV